MCFFGNDDDPDPVVPDAPPEVLKQEAPVKKKTARADNTSNASALSIGTKKYRSASTSSPVATSNTAYPTVAQ